MKNYIILIILLSLIGACHQDDELAPLNGRVDLTRNTPREQRWWFELPILDSIDKLGHPYYENTFPNSCSLIIMFGLKSLNKENTIYLRTTEYDDPKRFDIPYCYDTIEVQANNNDSIICKIAVGEYNGMINYESYTFHGKFNRISGNVEGFVYPLKLSYRCPDCPGPGSSFRIYEGNVPAMFIPSQY